MATRAEWAERVTAWRASGMTARDFCREHGFSMSSMFLWSSRFTREAAQASAASTVQLARVVREPRAPRSRVIVIACGAVRVRLADDVSADVLARVIGVLRRSSS